MTVYELIQEITKHTSDAKINIELNIEKHEVKCPECDTEFYTDFLVKDAVIKYIHGVYWADYDIVLECECEV